MRAQNPAKAKRFGFLAVGIAALVALLVGALFGSGRDVGAVTAQPAATVTATATATVSMPTIEPSGESTDGGEGAEAKVGKFDQYHSYTDGVEVSVTSATKGTIPSLTAGGNPGDPMVIVTIKIKNGSKKSFDTDVVSVNLSYGSSSKQGKAVFPPGVEGFDGTIAQGRSRSGEYAFAVPSKGMKNIVVVINRGLRYPPATFAGKASSA